MIQKTLQVEYALFALLLVLIIAIVDVSAATSALFTNPITCAGDTINAVLRRPFAGYTGLAGLFAVTCVGLGSVFLFQDYWEAETGGGLLPPEVSLDIYPADPDDREREE